MARANSFRTGESVLPSLLSKPVVQWRHYLGGALASNQMVAIDGNADGDYEVVLISGGRLLSKRPDDVVLWETAPLGLQRIDQVMDFNRDGTLDVLATGANGFVGIFSAATGVLEWRTAPGLFGTGIGAVRVADLNGDGVDDLYLADAGCGSVNGKPVAYGFSFASGFGPVVDDGSRRLFKLEENRDYYCGIADVVADLDGDGKVEIITFSSTTMYAYDGATGAALPASAQAPGYPVGFSVPYGVLSTSLADVDGNGRRAIVGVTNNPYDPSINSRAALVVSFDRSLPAADRLKTRWFRKAAGVDDRHLFPPALVADLDGDGKAELLTTFLEGGVATTYILAGATGEVLAQLPNAQALGTALLTGGKPTALLRVGSELRGYRFDAFAGGNFGAPKWTSASGEVGYLWSEGRTRSASSGEAVATLPLASGGEGLAVVRGGAVELIGGEPTAAVVASYPLPSGVAALAFGSVRTARPEETGLLLPRSDGFLLVLDSLLRPVNFTSGGELALPGIRTGGYYSGPRAAGPVAVAARMGKAHEELLVRNSLGGLMRVDASNASLTRPPEIGWTLPGAVHPMVMDLDRDGTRDAVVVLEGTRLVGRSLDRQPLFSVTTGAGGWLPAGPPVPLSSASGWRYAVQEYNPSNGLGRVEAVDSSGPVWQSSPISVAASGRGELSVDDFDGDGQEDPYCALSAPLRFYSGADGHLLTEGAPVYATMPITVRGRAGAVTNIAAASHMEMTGLSITRPTAALQEVWKRFIPSRYDSTFATVVECGDGLRLVAGGFDSSHLQVVDVETGAVRWEGALASGRVFSSDAEATAQVGVLGGLGNASSTRQLLAGKPGVVVGSTDGYLYAVDACSAQPALHWSLNLRAAVGEPIFADTDGDGTAELVVQTDDGFINGIGQERFAAPAEVLDLDLSRGLTTVDVDETFGDQLSASWTPVAGATGYAYALFTRGGTPLTRSPTDPGDPFIRVGSDQTRADVAEGLKPGGTYFFSVRAFGPGGSSAEALSDGTRFVSGTPPQSADGGTDGGADGGSEADAGTGGKTVFSGSGCHCGATGSADLGAWGVALVAWLGSRGRVARGKSRRGRAST